jgi:hypothetical protein
MACGGVSKKANKLIPLVVKNSTRQDLYNRNLADYDLFTKLVTCPTGVNFPKETLADFVDSY